MIERLEVEARGLRFSARAAGPADGPPVLLLHGFPETGACWSAQLHALAGAGFRAVAPDQRGYSPGARPEGTDAYRVPELVADVIGIVDALGWDRFHLVGHDWGAGVSWQVAGRHADRVRSLTAVSVPHPAAFAAAITGDPDQAERSRYMSDWRGDGPEARLLADDAAGLRATLPAAHVEEHLAVLRQPGALTAAVSWYRASTGRDLFRGLGPVTAPTMFVWSDGDTAVGRAAADACAEHVVGPYRFEVLEGVGHFVAEEAPDAFNRLLLQHLGA